MDRGEMPWGTLKGVRPVKLAYGKLSEGICDEGILSFLADKYGVSEKKARLAIEVAKKEAALAASTDPEGYCLYIGIPFCPDRCLYCSFASVPIADHPDGVGDYLDALEAEMAHCACLMRGRTVNSIYIGGGTPTTLSPEDMESLFERVERHFDVGACPEYTCESGRADSITASRLEIMKEHGVTRICVNPQSMNERTLEAIGRKHTPKDVTEAFKLARKYGFNNINMDIIMGLPGESIKDFRNTLEAVKRLSPDALTVHSLAVKRGSRLRENTGKYETIGDKEAEEMALYAQIYARGMGMEPYYLYRQKHMAGNLENTGWALPGRECIYNVLTMEEICSVYAIGAGTVTKRVSHENGFQAARCDTVKSPDEYIRRIDEMMERKTGLFTDSLPKR